MKFGPAGDPSRYMTSDQLDIEEWEREGLAWFVDAARRGFFTRYRRRFEMGTTIEGGPATLFCGTAACLGGWIALRRVKQTHGLSSRRDIGDYVSIGRSNPLHDLFYPGMDQYGRDPEEVARVVELFLVHGVVNWDAAGAQS